MTCFCTCCDETFVLLPKTCFVVNYSSLFTFSVELEELLTVGQSLLRISIAFWLDVRACVDWRSLIA
jgi:hypothetical protein